MRDRIKVKPKFRKIFLNKVQGERVSVKVLPPPPLILEGDVSISYWINRLIECEAISQEIAETLKAQAEHLSYSGSKQSQQKTEATNDNS